VGYRISPPQRGEMLESLDEWGRVCVSKITQTLQKVILTIRENPKESKSRSIPQDKAI